MIKPKRTPIGYQFNRLVYEHRHNFPFICSTKCIVIGEISWKIIVCDKMHIARSFCANECDFKVETFVFLGRITLSWKIGHSSAYDARCAHKFCFGAIEIAMMLIKHKESEVGHLSNTSSLEAHDWPTYGTG